MSDERKMNLLNKMKEADIDLIVLVPGSNLSYITGNKFSQSERILLYFLREDGIGYYLVPEVEKTKLKLDKNDLVYTYTDGEGIDPLLRLLKENFNPLNCVGIESNVMRLFEFETIQKLGIPQFVNAMDMMNEMRIIKDDSEIKGMQNAVHILEESLLATLPFIEVGKQEVEVAARLEYEMRIRGSEGTPFSTIVASGHRGALPHGRASEKEIEDGDLIVIDFGAIYNGYVGDMTRTIGIGNVASKEQEVYKVVQEAITSAIKSIKIGQCIADIDATARQVIAANGYGDYFTHRLGHGIGLDAHEEPYIASSNKDVIKSGMSFTIEPGIYIENEFGIRIEDNIVVMDSGIKNLMTEINYDLIVL